MILLKIVVAIDIKIICTFSHQTSALLLSCIPNPKSSFIVLSQRYPEPSQLTIPPNLLPFLYILCFLSAVSRATTEIYCQWCVSTVLLYFFNLADGMGTFLNSLRSPALLFPIQLGFKFDFKDNLYFVNTTYS